MSDVPKCHKCGEPDHPLKMSEGRDFWYKNCRGSVLMVRNTTRAERDEIRREDAARATEQLTIGTYQI